MSNKIEALKTALKKLKPVPKEKVEEELRALEIERRALSDQMVLANRDANRQQAVDEYLAIEGKRLQDLEDIEKSYVAALAPVRASWDKVEIALVRSEEIREKLQRAAFLAGSLSEPPKRLTQVVVPSSPANNVLNDDAGKRDPRAEACGWREIQALRALGRITF